MNSNRESDGKVFCEIFMNSTLDLRLKKKKRVLMVPIWRFECSKALTPCIVPRIFQCPGLWGNYWIVREHSGPIETNQMV